MNIKKGYNIPSCLELKKSSIHGLGIFATKFISKESNLGICHYYDYSESPVRHLRNPFVGFLTIYFVPVFGFSSGISCFKAYEVFFAMKALYIKKN